MIFLLSGPRCILCGGFERV